MRGWGSGDIDGSHFGVAHQRLGISIVFIDTMTLCIRFRLVFVAAHHCHHFTSFYLAESRTTLFLRHLTTTDESPFHDVLNFHFLRKYDKCNILLCKGTKNSQLLIPNSSFFTTFAAKLTKYDTFLWLVIRRNSSR